MDFQVEEVIDDNKNVFCESPGDDSNDSSDNDAAMSPTHFLHSWESERKLIDVLITLSEEGYEDEKSMDPFVPCGGWDDAVHCWRTDNLHSFIPMLKKTNKSRNDSHCAVCAEMVPIVARKTGQDIEHSKSFSNTFVYNVAEEDFSSIPAKTPASQMYTFSSTVSQVQASEASKEIHTEDKTETEINPHKEKEYEMILGTIQQMPFRKHFSLLPPVKIVNDSDMSAPSVNPGTNFSWGTQNGNPNMKIVSEALENSGSIATKYCLRTHHCNMAMLQVSDIEKTAISPPIGITRIMNHWCWRYPLLQDNHNLFINGVPASKLKGYHRVGLQPMKITKHHTKNTKQDIPGKSAFSHSGSTDKRQKVTGHNILPMLPQPGPPPPSRPRIAVSVLPQRLL